jgi:protein O-mannosyl-transferase
MPSPAPVSAPLGDLPSDLRVFASKNPRLRILLLAALLVGAIILSYQPAWNAGFIWDDDEYVTHNPLLTATDGLRRIWFSTDSPSQYFPLVYTNFRAQHALWGLDPAGYHWVNILLHAVNALLVWRLLSRLAIPGAWLGAALFALHPLQVESVAWITELKNVQSLFFSLLALLAWERFVKWRELPAHDSESAKWHGRPAHDQSSGSPSGSSLSAPRSLLLYAAALGCHALALFSKTTACTLPAALVLILWIRRRPLDLRRWLQIAPFVLLGLAMGLVSVWWERHQQGTVGAEFFYSPIDRVLIAARALCFYFGKLLWPDNLTFIYPLWTIDARSPAAWAWFLPLGALAALVFALRRRLGRGPEAALVFFAATLLPLLGFFMLYTFRYTFVADHYVYVALVGPAALAGAAFTRLAPRLRAVHAALPPLLCGALLLGLATLSWRQSRQYHDLRALWETTIARSPSTFMAHNNLGVLELGAGRADAAVACFERALALKPDHPSALANLANARLVQGRPAEALALFRRVTELSPSDAKAWSDLGQALETTGAPAEAAAHYRRALDLDPKLAEARFLLARRLLAEGRAAEAGPHLERALALHEDYVEARYHLGLVRLAEERPAEAAACFERVVALAPAHAFALHNLALLRAASGRVDEAQPLLLRAVAAAPADPAIRHSLARALLALGRVADAEPELREVLRLAPDLDPARIDLAQTQLELGRFSDAAATLQIHLVRHPGDFEARHGLGRVLLAAGRPAEAAAAFRRVLSDAPDHAASREALATLETSSPPPPASGVWLPATRS